MRSVIKVRVNRDACHNVRTLEKVLENFAKKLPGPRFTPEKRDWPTIANNIMQRERNMMAKENCPIDCSILTKASDIIMLKNSRTTC
jgi:hypothetical protein